MQLRKVITILMSLICTVAFTFAENSSQSDYSLLLEKEINNSYGYGYITSQEVENQRKENEKKGYGYFADVELDVQRAANEKAGFGKITDEEADSQRSVNKKAGLGEITDAEVKVQIEKNKVQGFGEYTDTQVRAVKKEQALKDWEKGNYIACLSTLYDLMEEDPSINSAEVLELFEERAGWIKKAAFSKDDKLSDKERFAEWSKFQVQFEEFWKEKPAMYIFIQTDELYSARISEKYYLLNSIVREGYDYLLLNYEADGFNSEWLLDATANVTDIFLYAMAPECYEVEYTSKMVDRKPFYTVERWGFYDSDKEFYEFSLSDLRLENEYKKNKNAGIGYISAYEAVRQCVMNSKETNGIEPYTDEFLKSQRSANDKAGLGRITDREVKEERKKNVKAGKGNFTDYQISRQKSSNDWQGWGSITDYEKKKYSAFVMVKIPGLNIEAGAVEVTQGLWKYVMGNKKTGFETGALTKPVNGISWENACAFCNKLSEMKGYTPVYSVNGLTDPVFWRTSNLVVDESADGYRLPTEYEWVYMARAGENFIYSGSDKLNEVASYNGNGPRLSEVARYKANAFGLYDMTGNVQEWCWEGFEDAHFVRGGSFRSSEKECRITSYDLVDTYNYYSPEYGFRIVRSTNKKSMSRKSAFASQFYREKAQRIINSRRGYGELTDAEVEDEKSFNEKRGYGRITNNQLASKKDKGEKVSEAVLEKINSLLEMIQIPGKDYKMQKTEVTQELFELVMGYNPSENKSGKNLPVENVCWFDTIYFCNRLSELTGLTPVYSVNGSTNVKDWNYVPGINHFINGQIEISKTANGYQLPSIEQYSYCASAGTKEDYSVSSLKKIAWYSGNSKLNTHPAARKQANEFGLYDLLGNVKEISSEKETKVCTVFGGSAYDYEGFCNVSSTSKEYVSFGSDFTGFRVVSNNK